MIVWAYDLAAQQGVEVPPLLRSTEEFLGVLGETAIAVLDADASRSSTTRERR